MKKAIKSAAAASLAAVMMTAVMSGCNSSDDPKVFKIGGTGPLTGENASYGTSVRNGAQVAVEEINAAGGVNGMKLELYFEDDEADPQKAANAYSKLMDQKIKAIIGATTTDASIALSELTQKDNILQITPSGSGQDCTKYDNAFRICFTDPLQGTSMADYIYDTMKKTKTAILYDNSNDYSKGITDAFVARYKEKGGEIVVQESFGKDDVDFAAQLNKVKTSQAEAIFVPAYYQKVAAILQQSQRIGLQLPFFGCDGWDGVLKQLGNDKALAEGAIFLTPFAANDPAENVQKFVKAYKEKNDGATPDQFAADAYDAVYVLVEAIKEAGIQDSSKVDSQALIDAMTKISFDGLTGSMKFDKSGEPKKDAKVVEVVNGEYTVRK